MLTGWKTTDIQNNLTIDLSE